MARVQRNVLAIGDGREVEVEQDDEQSVKAQSHVRMVMSTFYNCVTFFEVI